MEKKSLLVMILIVIMMIPLVSAQYGYWDFRQASEQIIEWIQQILGPFFSVLIGEASFDQYFFARVLILILIFVIVSSVLRRTEIFKKNYMARLIIAFVVSVLGARFITESEFVQGILLPYGILAVALAIGLPFIIYFFFIHDSIESPTGRKFAWIIFIAVFLGMWIDRADEVGNANWVYAIGAILAAVAAASDNVVHRYFNLQGIGAWRRRVNDARSAALQAEYQNIRDVNTPQAERRREQIIDELRDLGGSIPRGFTGGGGI